MSSTLTANPLRPGQAALWNFAVIGGQMTPGVMTVTSCPRKFKIDKKAVAGAQGWTNTYQGWEAGDAIRVKIRFYKEEQIDDFYALIFPLIYIDADKAPPTAGITFDYPSLAANNITKLMPVQIGELYQADPRGLWAVDLEFVEWRPAGAKNLSSTPSGAAKAGSPAQEKQDPDVNFALRDERNRKAQMARKTGVGRKGSPNFIGPPTG